MLRAGLLAFVVVTSCCKPDESKAVPLEHVVVIAPDRPAFGSPAILESRRNGDRSDVWVRQGEVWKNLTRFDGVRHVVLIDSSPCGRWALVWHGEEPSVPSVVSIFETGTSRLTGHFTHHEGDLFWTAYSGVFTWSGRGTDVRVFGVHDTEGKLRLSGDAWNSVFSPDNRFLLKGPVPEWEAWETAVFDLQELKVVFRHQAADRAGPIELDWMGRREARVELGPSEPLLLRFTSASR